MSNIRRNFYLFIFIAIFTIKLQVDKNEAVRIGFSFQDAYFRYTDLKPLALIDPFW